VVLQKHVPGSCSETCPASSYDAILISIEAEVSDMEEQEVTGPIKAEQKVSFMSM
jgi:hypothetical protein